MWCNTCPIKEGCSPLLKPQVIRRSGYIDENPMFKLNPYACRHSSCPDGIAEARSAKEGESRPYTVCDSYGANPRRINGAPFETENSKPTKEKELRIVDFDDSQIYSFQDGMYLPTGQYA